MSAKEHEERLYKMMAEQGETSRGYQDFAKWLADIIPAQAAWIGVDLNQPGGLKVLDYATGPGVVSKAMEPYAKQIVAVDSSSAMIDAFKRRFNDSDGKIKGYLGDLIGDEDDVKFEGEEFKDFDLITCSMAFHHFENPRRAAQKLANRLKKGGALFIIEFNTGEDGHGHGHSHGHAHGHTTHGHQHEQLQTQPLVVVDSETGAAKPPNHGFQKHAITDVLSEAGLKNVQTLDPEVSFVWNVEAGKIKEVMAFDLVHRKKGQNLQEEWKGTEVQKLPRDIIMARGTKL